MSQGNSGTEPVKEAFRTVTPPYHGHSDSEMNAIGIAMFLGLLVLMVPLLPFLVIVWAISKLTEALAQKAPIGEEE
ncbi:hypothetical protein ACFFQF_07845 [Haladaptatus pallidirubidus]|uniref:Uncharacterized protein n=1 Tax=Haladaptatus pallidirubidus TaxID=1008152 RepID=A0AAV3UHM2_9EURY|nr:hypothetical protein [Haladaptatus pallidirubidus]